MTRKVTTTVMIFTDGTRSVFGAFAGTLHVTKRGTWFDSARSLVVGRVTVTDGTWPSYREIAERFATAEYPAFTFEGGGPA